MLNEALPNGQAILDLLDLPGTYASLIGRLREPVPNDKGELSILAPTTLATRSDLIDRFHRATVTTYLSVAQTRAQEPKRHGLTVYAEGRIPKKGMETIFNCEPSELRKRLITLTLTCRSWFNSIHRCNCLARSWILARGVFNQHAVKATDRDVSL